MTMEALYNDDTWDRIPQKITDGLNDEIARAILFSQGWRIEYDPQLLAAAREVSNPVLDQRYTAALQPLLDQHVSAYPIRKVTSLISIFKGRTIRMIRKAVRFDPKRKTPEDLANGVAQAIQYVENQRHSAAQGFRHPVICQFRVEGLIRGDEGQVTVEEEIIDGPEPEEFACILFDKLISENPDANIKIDGFGLVVGKAEVTVDLDRLEIGKGGEEPTELRLTDPDSLDKLAELLHSLGLNFDANLDTPQDRRRRE